MLKLLRHWVGSAIEARHLPKLRIDLQLAKTAGNDPFFEHIVRTFYMEAMQRHRKFPLVRQYQYGFCVCTLPADFKDYFGSIESAGRRNYKKSLRLGYTFSRLDYNAYLDDVVAIIRSSDVRQGKAMPEHLQTRVSAGINDPPSRSNRHDYPYYGIFRDGHLYAYASCLIAGELCAIQTIFGHVEHQDDGIVPMLIISLAECVIRDYPHVRYYAYGSYYGATPSMQRFKRKFGFMPHLVRWELGA
ncbi:hypothetical protein ACVWWQ_000357 [Rhodanobacter sp. TND4EL1]